MLKKILTPLLVLAISGAVCLVVAELAIRLVRPQARLVITPGGLYTPDPPGRYRLTPGYQGRIYNRVEYDNQIRINQQGLRGPELDRGDAAAIRILVIGDSFAFGVGVEDTETFTALLPDQLDLPAERVESLNAGIPAFGVPDAVSWLARHGLTLEPDIVILAIFLGNDLADAVHLDEDVVIVDGLLAPKESARGLKVWLHRHSQLYVAVKGLLEQPMFVPLRQWLGLREPWRVRTLREEFGVYSKSAATDLADGVEATDRALEQLQSLSTEVGFEVFAVLIPSEIQVDPERWRSGLTSLALDPAAYDPEAPTRIFRQLLDRHQIATLDLSPIFAERIAAGEDLYFRFDRHWKRAGHALAAAEIARFIAETQEKRKAGSRR